MLAFSVFGTQFCHHCGQPRVAEPPSNLVLSVWCQVLKQDYKSLGLITKKDKMASSPSASPLNAKVQRGGYVAEVIISKHQLFGEVYMYVIQREGHQEILHMGQEVSLQRALECINEFIDKRMARSA